MRTSVELLKVPGGRFNTTSIALNALDNVWKYPSHCAAREIVTDIEVPVVMIKVGVVMLPIGVVMSKAVVMSLESAVE